MTRAEILKKVAALHFPEGSYVVFGSAPMAMAGLREAKDIDFLVSQEMFEDLKQRGWQERDKGGLDKPLVYEDFEAHPNWNFSSYSPTLEQLLATADVVDGIPFAALSEVRKWKAASARPKDGVDVELIDRYLSSL